MENQNNDQQETVNQIYKHAANLLVNQKKSASETRNELVEQGLDEESASIVVANLEQQIKDAKKEGANKDMLYGALWVIGGIVATVADFGFIFWGQLCLVQFSLLRGLRTLKDGGNQKNAL